MEHGLALSVVLALAVTLVCWSLLSDRLDRWNVSGPIVFVAVGWVLTTGLGVLDVTPKAQGVRTIAEFALAFVLFGDAARVSLRELRRDASVIGRLLLVGLPVTAALGVLAAHSLLPSLSWAVAAVIGTAVAPTDAALGAAIVEDERVPLRIRSILNVESGLNDGIVTPFVNLFLVAAVAGTALEHESDAHAVWGLILGVVMGAVVGAFGAALLSAARRAGLGGTAYEGLAVLGLAVTSYVAVVQLSGNGFVAAFVAGLAYGRVAGEERAASLTLTHDVSRLFSYGVWFLFGAAMLPSLRHATWRELVFAILALTLIRMLPVALVLIGAGFDGATRVVVGWFGPRGLASVVFALLAYESLFPGEGRAVLTTITATVLLSVVLHGVTAAPISRWYAGTHHD